MQEILRKFESILTEQDILTVRLGVEELLRIYVPRTASPELRKAVCDLLNRAGAESSNRVLTSYLRTVAHTIEHFSGPSSLVATTSSSTSTAPMAAKPKQESEKKSITPEVPDRGLNSLGKYLSNKRG